jgi:hypothetical protein
VSNVSQKTKTASFRQKILRFFIVGQEVIASLSTVSLRA